MHDVGSCTSHFVKSSAYPVCFLIQLVRPTMRKVYRTGSITGFKYIPYYGPDCPESMLTYIHMCDYADIVCGSISNDIKERLI